MPWRRHGGQHVGLDRRARASSTAAARRRSARARGARRSTGPRRSGWRGRSTSRCSGPCPARTRSVSAPSVSSMSVSELGAVDLVEVDPVGAEAAQAVLDLADDPAPRVAELVGVVAHRAVDLGREDHVVAAAAGERLADDLLGLAARVDVGGVDEVDPRVERAVDDRDRLVVVGLAPGAEHHGAEAERADLDAGVCPACGAPWPSRLEGCLVLAAECPSARTSATSRSSPTSTTARPRWSTPCCASPACSPRTSSSPTA